MKFELEVARRFAFPSRVRQTRPSFITLIAVIGLALGTAALILTLTIVYGFSRVIESKIALFGAHIQVSHASLKEMPLDTVVLSEISKVPNVAAVSPFLQRSVILKSRAPNGDPLLEPALLKGIVPTEDVSRICEKVVAGAFLSDSAYRSGLPILIGKKLAQRLALSPQSEALVIASATALDASTVLPQSPEALLEQLRLDNAVVVGIYETGLAQGFDEAVVFTTLPALQRFVGAPKRISGYEVRTVEFEQVRQTGNELNQILRPPLMARTIYQLHSAIYAWLSLQKNVVPLLLVMVTIVAAFNVVSTLLIIVLEKSAEIGVLMSFGASPKHIRRIFVSQAFFIALVGIAAGNALALCLSLLEKHFHLIPLPAETYYISETPIFIEPLHYGVVSITALAIALLASLIPAQSASRLKPIDAIRL